MVNGVDENPEGSAGPEQGQNYADFYFEERMASLGVDAEKYVVREPIYAGEYGRGEITGYEEYRVFEKEPEGHIKINYYNRLGAPVRFRKNGERSQQQLYAQLRMIPGTTDKKGDPIRYKLPAGGGTYPFLPPEIIDKWQRKEKIKTLTLTEGAFKATAASVHGMDIIGLPSITHYKDSDTNEIHLDIQHIIRDCQVESVIWLHDGDCREITSKFIKHDEEALKIDLYKRPYLFFRTVMVIRQMLKKFDDLDLYYAAVNGDRVDCEGAKPKGLDDLLEELLKGERDKDARAKEVIADLEKVGHNSHMWFDKFDMTHGIEQIRKWYHIDNPERFYQLHEPKIGDSKFTYHGTIYLWTEKKGKGELEVIVPERAKDYVRVGPDYYCWVDRPRANPEEGSDRILEEWTKATIVDDHGKNFLNHIRKLKTFTIRPDHQNYQEIIDGCLNLYHPFAWEKREEGSWESIKSYLTHIFGSNTIKYIHPKTKEEKEVNELELGLDYIQLLYQKPTQKLPILCLVSKEKETGKSTLIDLLKLIFTQNAILVGNSDLSNDFNGFWASKLLIMSNEVFIEKKQILEMLKNLATSNHTIANSKNKSQKEQEFFGKFIFTSNDEEKFITTDEEETRYWVRKVPALSAEQKNPSLLAEMAEEIPAFLHMLESRKMKTDRCTRSWFHVELTKTDALAKVIAYNKSTVHKEIREYFTDLFLMSGEKEILMDAISVKSEVFGKNHRYEITYIHKVLKEEMGIPKHRNEKGEEVVCRFQYPHFSETENAAGRPEILRRDKPGRGRCYVFKREMFVTAEVSMDADLEQENSMHNEAPKNTLFDGDEEDGQDDLPF